MFVDFSCVLWKDLEPILRLVFHFELISTTNYSRHRLLSANQHRGHHHSLPPVDSYPVVSIVKAQPGFSSRSHYLYSLAQPL